QPHLVLANVGGDDCLAACHAIQFLTKLLRLDDIMRRLVTKWSMSFPFFNLLPPQIEARCSNQVPLLRQHAPHLPNGAFGISHNGAMGAHIFSVRRRININMNDLSMRGKLVQRSGHTVVKTYADSE